MSQIHSYPKIFPVGSDYIADLFKGEVEITEKVDGSLFAFGQTAEGKLVFRSKGQEMYREAYQKMFQKAVDFVLDNEEKILALPKSTYFYGEFLSKEKHNTLCYERVPKNNIIIFGVLLGESFVKDHAELVSLAAELDLEAVPLLYSGEVSSFEELTKYIDRDSVLGKEKLEGVVVKNYAAQCIIGSRVMPCFGKFVREDFKERHEREWKSTFGKKAQIDSFLDGFRTEARWVKAVQHLREQGKLLNDPKDIGVLLREVGEDIIAEETENIKNDLYKIYIDQIVRKARAGFPEWYKEQLAKMVGVTK